MSIATVSALISVLAFLVAAYGIVERRGAANRADRLRLTEITAELAELRLKLIELGEPAGNRVEAMNSRIALLGQQALSLIKAHELTLTSAECREVAVCLESSGYGEEAEGLWGLAREAAKIEGVRSSIFAERGYAYFLFRNDRPDDARRLLRNLLKKYPPSTDADRVVQAQMLASWRVWEVENQGQESSAQQDLRRRLEELVAACSSQRGKRMVSVFLEVRPGPEPAELDTKHELPPEGRAV